jgi:hypothetical protein
MEGTRTEPKARPQLKNNRPCKKIIFAQRVFVIFERSRRTRYNTRRIEMKPDALDRYPCLRLFACLLPSRTVGDPCPQYLPLKATSRENHQSRLPFRGSWYQA